MTSFSRGAQFQRVENQIAGIRADAAQLLGRSAGIAAGVPETVTPLLDEVDELDTARRTGARREDLTARQRRDLLSERTDEFGSLRQARSDEPAGPAEPPGLRALPQPERVDPEELNRRYADIPGLVFDRPETPAAAEVLATARRRENLRNAIIARSPNDWTQFGGTLVMSFVASLFDPIELASGFIPIVRGGQAAALSAQAARAFGRRGGLVAGRAAEGAIEGAVGSLLIEPFYAAGRGALGLDYTLRDALLSVGAGAILGGAIGGGVGVYNARQQARRDAQRYEIERRIRAGEEIDPGELRAAGLTEADRARLATQATLSAALNGVDVNATALFSAPLDPAAAMRAADLEAKFARELTQIHGDPERAGMEARLISDGIGSLAARAGLSVDEAMARVFPELDERGVVGPPGGDLARELQSVRDVLSRAETALEAAQRVGTAEGPAAALATVDGALADLEASAREVAPFSVEAEATVRRVQQARRAAADAQAAAGTPRAAEAVDRARQAVREISPDVEMLRRAYADGLDQTPRPSPTLETLEAVAQSVATDPGSLEASRIRKALSKASSRNPEVSVETPIGTVTLRRLPDGSSETPVRKVGGRTLRRGDFQVLLNGEVLASGVTRKDAVDLAIEASGVGRAPDVAAQGGAAVGPLTPTTQTLVDTFRATRLEKASADLALKIVRDLPPEDVRMVTAYVVGEAAARTSDNLAARTGDAYAQLEAFVEEKLRAGAAPAEPIAVPDLVAMRQSMGQMGFRTHLFDLPKDTLRHYIASLGIKTPGLSRKTKAGLTQVIERHVRAELAARDETPTVVDQGLDRLARVREEPPTLADALNGDEVEQAAAQFSLEVVRDLSPEDMQALAARIDDDPAALAAFVEERLRAREEGGAPAAPEPVAGAAETATQRRARRVALVAKRIGADLKDGFRVSFGDRVLADRRVSRGAVGEALTGEEMSSEQFRRWLTAQNPGGPFRDRHNEITLDQLEADAALAPSGRTAADVVADYARAEFAAGRAVEYLDSPLSEVTIESLSKALTGEVMEGDAFRLWLRDQNEDLAEAPPGDRPTLEELVARDLAGEPGPPRAAAEPAEEIGDTPILAEALSGDPLERAAAEFSLEIMADLSPEKMQALMARVADDPAALPAFVEDRLRAREGRNEPATPEPTTPASAARGPETAAARRARRVALVAKRVRADLNAGFRVSFGDRVIDDWRVSRAALGEALTGEKMTSEQFRRWLTAQNPNGPFRERYNQMPLDQLEADAALAGTGRTAASVVADYVRAELDAGRAVSHRTQPVSHVTVESLSEALTGRVMIGDEFRLWLMDQSEGLAETPPGERPTLEELVARDAPREQSERSRIVRGRMFPGSGLIQLLQQADRSTFLHETGHVFEIMLERLARQPDASPEIRRMQGAIEAWKRSAANDRVPEDEVFARGFERYLRTGNAPTERLREAFRAFAAWLKKIYVSIAGSPIEVDLPAEIREMFDQILTTPEFMNLEPPVRVASAEDIAKAATAIENDFAAAPQAAVELAAISASVEQDVAGLREDDVRLQAEVEQIRQRGDLTSEDEAALAEIQQIESYSQAYARAAREGAACLAS